MKVLSFVFSGAPISDEKSIQQPAATARFPTELSWGAEWDSKTPPTEAIKGPRIFDWTERDAGALAYLAIR